MLNDFLQQCCVHGRQLDYVAYRSARHEVSLATEFERWAVTQPGRGLRKLPVRGADADAMCGAIGVLLGQPVTDRIRHKHHGRVRCAFEGYRLRGTDPSFFDQPLDKPGESSRPPCPIGPWPWLA